MGCYSSAEEERSKKIVSSIEYGPLENSITARERRVIANKTPFRLAQVAPVVKLV